MYTFKMKTKYNDVEDMLDRMMSKPLILIKEPGKARKLGQIAKPLRDARILHISPDDKLGESVAFLKVNNVIKPKSVKKKKGKRIEYKFDNMLIPITLY